MNLEPRKTIGAPPPPSDYRSTAHKKTPNLSDGRRGATRGRYLGNTIAIVFRPMLFGSYSTCLYFKSHEFAHWLNCTPTCSVAMLVL